MSLQWQPHGLIVKPVMESLYLSAKALVDQNGNLIDPREYKNVKLFEYLFNKVLFTEDNYACMSQQPPDARSTKACDICIKYATVQSAWQILCFAEAKRASHQSDPQIKSLEDQAYRYCRDFVDDKPSVTLIYACTLVGASIRCWSVDRGAPRMKGFWAGDQDGSYQNYLDIGLERNKASILDAFNLMKSMPPAQLPQGMSHSNIGFFHDHDSCLRLLIHFEMYKRFILYVVRMNSFGTVSTLAK